jgi:hypothetical protein
MTHRPRDRQVLPGAWRHIKSSEEHVASSIVRLLNAEHRLSAAPPDGRARHARALLGLLEHPCDLDLIVFFFRHPRALLTLHDVAARVGYHEDQVRAGVDTLERAGLLTWSKGGPEESASDSRLFELTPGAWADILPAFLWVARSVDGRRTLRRALTAAAQ